MSAQDSLISELEEAISHGNDERRAKTLRRVTDLFVFGSGHFSEDHIALFDGVFNHLIAHIEESARTMLANQLASIVNAPPKAIRALAFDDAITVAGPVLKQSPQLDNAALVENARTKSQQHLLAISKRKSLAETVTDVLVERGDRQVALSTAQNPSAKFSEAGYVRLVKRAEGDDQLAQTVGSRAEIPRHHFLRILAKASQAVRVKLEGANQHQAGEVQRAVAHAATEIQTKAAASSHNYAAANALVGTLRAEGRLRESDIETFAREGKFEEATAALAILSELPTHAVERAIVHDRVESILIICKAIGLSWNTVKAVLTLRRADKGGVSKYDLENYLALFTRLKQGTARHVLKFQFQSDGDGPSAA
jgi:uncharacterized protein (DUF2336 family)